MAATQQQQQQRVVATTRKRNGCTLVSAVVKKTKEPSSLSPFDYLLSKAEEGRALFAAVAHVYEEAKAFVHRCPLEVHKWTPGAYVGRCYSDDCPVPGQTHAFVLALRQCSHGYDHGTSGTRNGMCDACSTWHITLCPLWPRTSNRLNPPVLGECDRCDTVHPVMCQSAESMLCHNPELAKLDACRRKSEEGRQVFAWANPVASKTFALQAVCPLEVHPDTPGAVLATCLLNDTCPAAQKQHKHAFVVASATCPQEYVHFSEGTVFSECNACGSRHRVLCPLYPTTPEAHVIVTLCPTCHSRHPLATTEAEEKLRHHTLLLTVQGGTLDSLQRLRTEHGYTAKHVRMNHHEALMQAVLYERLDVLTDFRTQWGIDADDLRAYDNLQLRLAAMQGYVAMLHQFRVDWKLTGDDVRAVNHDALVLAATYGRVAVIQEFRLQPWGLDKRDARAQSRALLKAAVVGGFVDVLHELSDPHWALTKEDVLANGGELLLLAVQHNHVHVLQALRAPASRWRLTTADMQHDDNRALRVAALHGHLEVIRELQLGWGLTTQDARSQDSEALFNAVSNGHVAVVQAFRIEWSLVRADLVLMQNRALRSALEGRHVSTVHELRLNWGLTKQDVETAADPLAIELALFT